MASIERHEVVGSTSAVGCARLSTTGCAELSRWLNVLIHSKQVVRIVLRLDLCEPRVVVAIACAYPLVTLIHHHVRVGPSRRERMQGLEIVDGPAPDRFDVGRLQTYAGKHRAPVGVSIAPSRVGRVHIM